MEKSKKLIFFDVDYTLIKGSKAHKLAIVMGVKEISGKIAPIEKLNLPGMTDRQIIYDLMELIGMERAQIEKNMERCIDAIVEAYNKIKKEDTIELLEGVETLLQKLSKLDDVYLGLVTGNIEPIAYGKLSAVGIDHYFQIGGFGSDHIERPKLVEIAIHRAKNKYGLINPKTFVVGDTPKDIDAAKKSNSISIAVASGSYNKDELAKKGANLVLGSLSEIDKFIDFINAK